MFKILESPLWLAAGLMLMLAAAVGTVQLRSVRLRPAPDLPIAGLCRECGKPETVAAVFDGYELVLVGGEVRRAIQKYREVPHCCCPYCKE